MKMKYLLRKSFLIFISIISIVTLSQSQDNLNLSFKDAASAPQNLSICGNLYEVTVKLSLSQNNTENISAFSAQVSLFKGVQIVAFNSDKSSPGVSLTNNDPNKPNFNLPNMSKPGNTDVFITYSILADCSYLDSLKLNDKLVVKDKWNFSYLANGISKNETDFSAEYRDALKIPFLAVDILNKNSKQNIGQLFQRTILVTNSGLNAYLKNFNYSNIQGSGVSIKSVTVNGLPVVFTKSQATVNDTLINFAVDGNYFKLNTKGVGGMGNGNTLFDSDELVSIVETGVVVGCIKSRKSMHTVDWGCFGAACSTTSISDEIAIPQGSPLAEFIKGGSIADEVSGYCKNGVSTIQFRNSGIEIDPGTSNMYNISAGIGLGQNFSGSNGGFKITSLTIAGKNILVNPLNPMVDLNNNSIFSTDPDGPGGLSDLDGDGFYDDLPRNQSFEITCNYEVTCLNNNVIPLNSPCKNDMTTAFFARMSFSNYCNDIIKFNPDSYFAPINALDTYTNCSDPDAFTNGASFLITHTEIRNVFNFEKECKAGEQLIVKAILPKGVTPDLAKTNLMRLSQIFPLLSNSISNDTLILKFDAAALTYLNGIYTINLALKADCQATPGQMILPLIFEHFCPDCNCTHTFYCENIKGPVIHYKSPACPDNPLYACKDGLNTLSFEAERTTLGYTNKNFTTHISPANANIHAAISCDSIRLSLKSVVGQKAIVDSVGVKIKYSNVDKSKSNVETLIFGKGKLTITHNGQSFDAIISGSALSVETKDSLKILNFDFTKQLKSFGITLLEGDHVDFEGDFYLNPDGPYTTTFSKIPDFRAFAYAIVDGETKTCEDNGETFEIAKTKTGFIYPNSSTFPKGCQETELEYALIQVNNGYNDVFPNEFRAATKIDSLVFDFDPAILSAYSIFQPEVSIPGHPFYGNSFFPVNAFTSSGKYIVKFDTLNYVPALNTVGSKAFIFRFKIIPDCKSQAGSANGTNVFNFDPTIYYQARYHAKPIGDGSCVLKKAEYVDNDIVYSEPPKLSYDLTQSASNGNDVVWTVKLCNTSEIGDAGITWFNVAGDPESVYQINSIKDITEPANPVSLIYKPYGINNSKIFFFDEGLTNTQNGAASTNDLCNIIEIKASISKCGNNGFVSNAGWNCIPYADPSWTPDNYTPCQSLEIPLPVGSAIPQLDGNFVNQNLDGEDLCDEISIELLVRNIDQGIANNIKTQLIIPAIGANYVVGSAEIAYPSNAAFVPTVQEPIFEGLNAKGKIYTFENLNSLSSSLAQNGLTGFNPQNPSKDNEYRVRIKFKTDCDFVSGSYSYHSIFGKSSCGDFTKVDEGESLPILLKGVPVGNQPKLFSVAIDPSVKLMPGGNSNIIVNIENLETTLTDNFDIVQITIPSSLTYVNGSAQSITPLSWNPGDPDITSLGAISILKWYLPSGIAKNQKIQLKFSLNSAGIDCTDAIKQFGVETVAERIVNCVATNTICDNSFSTSVNGKNFFDIPVMKPVISVSSSTPNVTCTGDPIELTASGGNSYTWKNLTTGENLGGGTSIFVTPTNINTYQVTGGFGNCQSTATITLNTIIDNNPPVLHNIPDDLIAECDEVPPSANPSATDDCDTDVDISISETTTVIDKCLKIITRTWVATDNLGNTSSAQQIISLIDTKAPVISLAHPLLIGAKDGDTLTVKCGEMPILGANDVMVTDNCDPNPKVSFVDFGIVIGDCKIKGYSVLMICGWEAEDQCGNKTQVKLYFKIVDDLPPVLSGVPSDIILNFDDPIPTAAVVTAKDLCLGVVPVEFTENMFMIGCQRIIVRTWTAVDDCMNEAKATQTIKIKCPPCVIPEVENVIITNANCKTYGSVNLEVINAANYNFDWLPNVGTTNSSGSMISGLYPSTYNVIISSKQSSLCYKKLTINILNQAKCSDTIYIKTANDQTVDTCLNDFINLNKISSAYVCKDNPATANILLKQDKSCISIKPNPNFTGTDLLCVVHCDNNICDTTYIKIDIFQNKPVLCKDFILQKKTVLSTDDCDKGAKLCIEIPFTEIFDYNITDFGKPYNASFASCPMNAQLSTELTLFKGPHKLVFGSSLGCKDSIEVKVACHAQAIVKSNLYLGQVGAFTVKNTYLSGEKVTIKEASPLTNNNVEYILKPSEGTISYIAKKPGISSQKFIAISEDGSNIEISFDLKVIDDPISNHTSTKEYHFTTKQNEHLYLEVPNSGGSDPSQYVLNIMVDPKHGNIITAANKSIQYSPEKDFCGTDYFEYSIVYNGNTEYYKVFVEVVCDEFVIYNALSPNDDGLNDYFTIKGIEALPENSLKIYNRWGQEVFSAKPYLNNWDGRMKNHLLPDGTYYYYFDNGAGKVYKGFVYLQR